MTNILKPYLIGLVVALVFPKGIESCCSFGWRQFGDSCYFIMMEKYNWTAAQEVCQFEGGYLAEVESETEDNFLKQTLRNIFPATKCDELKHVGFFIGGSDVDTEGTFIWTKSKNRVTLPAWGFKEPNNHKPGEDCLEYKYYEKSFNGNDMICNAQKFSICEKPKK